jgi:predicted amidohydrolase YtcJ
MRKNPAVPITSASYLLSIAASLLLAACLDPGRPGEIAGARRPDMVLLNGKIITVDPQDSIDEALAIKDGKILAVGRTSEIEMLAGEHTRVIDLQGLTATPGLIDSHCHFASGGIARLYTLDLSYPNVKSISDVMEEVGASLVDRSPGEWIEGEGWDEGKLSDLRYIHASDIDPVSPQNPVWLLHTMGHYGTANSRALELANVTRDTPDPPGGTIDRYADGTPTGVLKESAMDLVQLLIPNPTPSQLQAAIAELSTEFSKEGMTAVKDPGIDEETWQAYQRALGDGKLSVRIFALWEAGKTVESARELIDRVGAFTKPYITTGEDRLISGGIKIFLDGSGGARTAWVYDEWNKNYEEVDTGNFGYPVIEPDIFRQQVLLFHDAGLHLGIHAIGDRAIDWVVDSYAAALERKPTHGLRHSVIHANVPTEHALQVLSKLQQTHDAGYPEPSPNFMWWIGDTYAGNWGPERSRRLNPFRTFADRGIKWGASSDYNVTPFAARYGLWASVQRETLLAVYGPNPYGTDESIDVRTALRSYTIWGARQLFLEQKIGSLEVGKYADIAVWNEDLYTIPAKEIKDLKCQLTLLGGEIVYLAPGTSIDPGTILEGGEL